MKRYHTTIKKTSRSIRLLGALVIKATDIYEAHRIANQYAIPYRRDNNRLPYVRIISL